METSELVQVIETLHVEARRRQLFFQYATDEQLRGREITINGRSMISFGSCSYLGLEHHPQLIEGACDAARRYGTQFSTSRGYVSAPLYGELEATFSRVFDAHVLVAPSTTLAHAAAFDALMTEKDAVVLDHQVHQSVHQASSLARTRGVRIEVVRHEALEAASDVVAALAKRYRTVWFAMDGVLSMYGDLAPFGFLRHLLALAPNVRLYIDDAHGMSWKGLYGRGSFLAHMPLDERIVVATSLAKAAGCGGGLLVFRDPAECDRVRMCGGTLLFSGPMQPPMLGAALASARLHLSDELVELQQRLRERVLYTNRALRAASLPLLVDNDVPIRFVRMGLPRVANEVAERVARDGIYVNVSMFPTVPMRRAGIRITINANHELADIDRLVASLAQHVPAVLADARLTLADMDTLFARSVVSHLHAEGTSTALAAPAAAPPSPAGPAVPAPGAPTDVAALARGSGADITWGAPLVGPRSALAVQHVRSIHELDAAEWDRLLGTTGMISADAMACAERVFRGQPRREHDWTFDYVIVRDGGGRPICATVFQTALQKDDFIMRDVVSRAVEARRERDPYYLTSLVVMSGTTLSEGHHVYVDRTAPWRDAMRLLVERAVAIYEREKADAIMFRDCPADDPAMDALMLDEGLLRVPMLDSHVLPITWTTADELIARLGFYGRKHVRRVLRASSGFRLHAYGTSTGRMLSADEQAHLWSLYRQLVRRKFRINVFELPPSLLPALLASPAWEIITLELAADAGGPADGRPVAWLACHRHGGHYGPLLGGFDDAYVVEHGAYKQMMLQVILRAQQLGMTHVHLGMDADVEKARYRPDVIANCVYTQVREHYNAALLREIVAEVGAGRE